MLKWLSAPLLLGAVGGIAACRQIPRVHDLDVSRDVGCSCCHAWTEMMQASGRFRVTMIETPDLPASKQELGVPAGLAACHTAVADGYVIEGHVPAEEILRLLTERPSGVKGIAAPGMPRGSPGMEQPDGTIDAYTVVAFDSVGRTSSFSEHKGNT